MSTEPSAARGMLIMSLAMLLLPLMDVFAKQLTADMAPGQIA